MRNSIIFKEKMSMLGLAFCQMAGCGCGGDFGDMYKRAPQSEDELAGQRPTDEPPLEASNAAAATRAWQYNLNYTDVTLSPDGRLLLTMVPAPGPGKGYAAPGLVLLARDLQSRVDHTLASLVDLRAMAFSADGQTLWALRADGQTVSAVNLQTLELGQSYALDSVFTALEVASGGRYLLLSNMTRDPVDATGEADGCGAIAGAGHRGKQADRCHVGVIDLKTGEHHAFATPAPPWQMGDSSAHDELVLVWSKSDSRKPHTTVAFYDPASQTTTALLELHRCGDQFERVPGSHLALVAAKGCGKDAMALIDLEKRSHIEDLPGAAPVTIDAQGKGAIALTHRQHMADRWGYDAQISQLGLVFIDLSSRSWQVVDYGDQPPTVTISPDGQWLYTFERGFAWREGKGESPALFPKTGELARWNVATGTRHVISKDTAPERWVWSATQMHFLSGGALFRLDSDTAELTHVPLTWPADLLNIRPQDDYLVLGRRHAPTFCTVPLHDDGKVAEMHLGL